MENILSKIMYKKLIPLFNDLSSLRYAVIKGEALSLLAYGSCGKRNHNDVDILISKNDISMVETLLNKNGFYTLWSNKTKSEIRANRIFCLSSSHQIASFYDITQNINIDINHNIFWGEYKGQQIDISHFLCDTAEMRIYGCTVKTLPPLKTLIQLALHNYKDLNSIFLLTTRPTIKQEMFKDMYYLLKNNIAEIPLDKLYNMCAEYEIIPYVYYVLYHTGILYNDEEFQRYIDAFKTTDGEALLNCYGLNDEERREWRFDFSLRLNSKNIYELIKDDMTDKDLEKILINKKVFLGE